MEHGSTWLNFLPGFAQIQHYLQTQQKGVLFGNAAAFQHRFYRAVPGP
ncbi:MAG: hypothetical protein HC841_02585 [Verrucomicrobiae bacterium]|nr:hypothetical protein [Verrucomicrobiae bacterium]